MPHAIRLILVFALLAVPAARAQAQGQPRPLLSRTADAKKAKALKTDKERVSQAAAAILPGALATASFGLAGFQVGVLVGGGTTTSAGAWALGGVLTGAVVGAWGGTMLGGMLAGGESNVGETLLGSMLGGGVSLVLLSIMAPAIAQSVMSPQVDWTPLILAGLAIVLPPLAGGIVGYQFGEARSADGQRGEDSRRLGLAISLTRDGKGATAGLAGTF